jgi:hypothetical protein
MDSGLEVSKSHAPTRYFFSEVGGTDFGVLEEVLWLGFEGVLQL